MVYDFLLTKDVREKSGNRMVNELSFLSEPTGDSRIIGLHIMDSECTLARLLRFQGEYSGSALINYERITERRRQEKPSVRSIF